MYDKIMIAFLASGEYDDDIIRFIQSPFNENNQ